VRWAWSIPLVAGFAALPSGAADAPPYEDRLIDGGKLEPFPEDALAASYNMAGPPRSWRVEGFGSRIEQGGVTRGENGLVINGRLDTADYGAFSIDGSLRRSSGSNVFTLWQRGLPFDDGWRANTGVGMLNTPTIDLSRRQFRFYLPTAPMAGVETEWLQSGKVQLQAGIGEPGLFNGLRIAGFSRLGGVVANAGAQWTLDPQWQAGVQVADVRAVRTGFDANDPKTTGRS
jgi:hypothetical protein